MFPELTNAIPPDLIKFFLVAVFSLLIGLEQRQQHINIQFESLFGTDRTFTLIGILGFVLYILSPQGPALFLSGGFALTVLLGIFYFQKTQQQQKFGCTTEMIALITYCLAPLVYTQPLWLSLLVVVAVLVLAGIKETLFEFSQKFGSNEFITLGKFLILAGVILPLLPNTPVSEQINISPYQIWSAIVVVSGISYLSYLLKKFVFPDAGILLTGLLGGLGSSTATTIILAKKSKDGAPGYQVVPAIILATTTMYVRIFLLALFFNMDIALALLPYFVFFIILSAGTAWFFMRKGKSAAPPPVATPIVPSRDNPLEFRTAIIFGLLFVFFAIVTTYVSKYYGKSGINTLAYVVGVTDITPFITNLFQSKSGMANPVIVMAVLNAIASNNLLKLIYALVLSDKSLRKKLITGFVILILLGVIAGFVSPMI